MQPSRSEETPMSVPRINEIGPSFKAGEEHFQLFRLDDHRWCLVIGTVDWGRGTPIPITLPDGADVEYYADLNSVAGEWYSRASDVENSLQDGTGDRMEAEMDSWLKSRGLTAEPLAKRKKKRPRP